MTITEEQLREYGTAIDYSDRADVYSLGMDYYAIDTTGQGGVHWLVPGTNVPVGNHEAGSTEYLPIPFAVGDVVFITRHHDSRIAGQQGVVAGGHNDTYLIDINGVRVAGIWGSSLRFVRRPR